MDKKIIKIGCEVFVIENIDERGHYIHNSFTIETYTGNIQNKEPQFCYELKFFALDNLPKKLFKPHVKIINNCINKILYS